MRFFYLLVNKIIFYFLFNAHYSMTRAIHIEENINSSLFMNLELIQICFKIKLNKNIYYII